MTAPRSSPIFSHRLMVGLVLALGVVASIASFRLGWAGEQERAEAEFRHLATLRHALTREILGHYEDALFALSTLFMLDDNVTRAEFVRAARQFEGRIAGAQAYEWVPLVTQEERPAIEAMLRSNHPEQNAAIREVDPSGGPPRPAPVRPFYYVIAYIQPFVG